MVTYSIRKKYQLCDNSLFLKGKIFWQPRKRPIMGEIIYFSMKRLILIPVLVCLLASCTSSNKPEEITQDEVIQEVIPEVVTNTGEILPTESSGGLIATWGLVLLEDTMGTALDPIKQIALTGTVIETENWKLYTNSDLGFKVIFPSLWEYEEILFNNNTQVGFGTRESRGAGYIWWVTIYTGTTVENIIKYDGSQFPNKKEVRKDITLANWLTWTHLTVTADILPDWISESIIIPRDDAIYVIWNNSSKEPGFDAFYKDFDFLSE